MASRRDSERRDWLAGVDNSEGSAEDADVGSADMVKPETIDTVDVPSHSG